MHNSPFYLIAKAELSDNVYGLISEIIETINQSNNP